MNRFLQVIDQFSGAAFTHIKVGLDLGSSTTRVRVGDSIRLQEPSCVTFHKKTKTIVAFGSSSEKMQLGETDTTEFVRPIKAGVMTDIGVTAQYLQAVLGQSMSQQQLSLLTMIAGVCVLPTTLTEVERTLFERTFAGLSLGRWEFVTKAQVWQRLLTTDPAFQGFGGSIDIGGDTTEVVVIGAGQRLRAVTLPFGTRTLIKEIQYLVRNEYNCLISWQTAEKILKNIGLQETDETEMSTDVKTAVRGKDLLTGKPTTITVAASQVVHELLVTFSQLIEYLELFFAQLPASLATTSLDKGFVLSGGGSQLKGVSSILNTEFGFEVSESKTADHDLIAGLW